jgi:CheY-like chemotaxis protein
LNQFSSDLGIPSESQPVCGLVLVTDINLGSSNIDGWAVARHAREIDPSFPVVYMSGNDAADWASMGVPNSIMLEKPFAPAQLVTAVSQLINAGTPSL